MKLPPTVWLLALLVLPSVPCEAKPKRPVPEPPQLVPQRGHGGEVTAIASSADGTLVASGGNEGRVFLWDVQQRRALTSIAAADGEVRGLALLPGGRAVVADGEIYSTESRIRLWDLRSAKVIRSFSGHPYGFGVPLAVSPDGAFVAAGGGRVTIWEAATGRLWVQLAGGGTGLVFLDEKRLCFASGNNTIVLDLIAGPASVHVIPTGPAQTLAISSDGKFLAHAREETVTIWDLATGAKLATHKLLGDLTKVAFYNARNDLVAVQRTGYVYRVHGDRWSEIEGLLSLGVVTGFVPLRDGVVATSNRGDGTVSLWAVDEGQPQEPLGIPSPAVTTFDAASDGSLLVAGDSFNQVRVWDMTDGTAWIAEVRQPDPFTPQNETSDPKATRVEETFIAGGSRFVRKARVRSVRLAKEGLAVVRDEGQVEVWDPRYRLRIFNTVVKDATDAMLVDGECLVLSGSTALQRFSIRDGKTLPPREVPKGSTRFARADDGSIAVGGYEDVTVFDSRWNVARTFPHLQSNSLANLAFIGPSTLLRWSWGAGELLELGTERTTAAPSQMGGSSQTIAVLPQRVITGGPDGQVLVWSPGAAKPSTKVTGHIGPIAAIAVSAGGKVVATAGADSSIRFWAVPSMSLLATLDLFPGADWLVHTPAGDFEGTPAAWSQATFHFPSEPLTIYVPEQFFSVFFRPGILQSVATSGALVPSGPDPARDAEALRHSKIPSVRIVSPHDTVEYETGKGSEGTWTQVTTGASFKSRTPSELRSVRVMHPPLTASSVALEVEIRDGGSGVRDCRVFQNQSLVHKIDGPFPVDARTRTGWLRMPLEVLAGSNELSVYCFNDVNVRSPIARVTVIGAASLKRSRRAYIVAMGGDGYGHGLPKLRYAEADALLALDALRASLAGTGDYAEADIVTVPLVGAQATGGNLLTALALLAGRPAGDASRAVPELGRLARARLEDTAIIFFAGHGAAHGDRYTLYPVDARTEPRTVGGIDDRQLETALRGVNASHLLLILDTCQSGKIIQTADDARRGPLNTRGFAQLAYEKRLQVLAAAQSYASAYETRELEHGLLTYALMENGLRERQADDAPADGAIESDEWLRYAVRRVPQLEGAVRRAEPAFEEEDSGRRVQQPQVYLPSGGSGLLIAKTTRSSPPAAGSNQP